MSASVQGLDRPASPIAQRARALLPDWLPRGQHLPEDQWRLRHRGLTALLWPHVVFVPLVGIVNGLEDPAHVILESAVLAALAMVASSQHKTHKVPMLATTVGLITSSALLVHFSGGLIEMHFHFFIMVAAVTLYQSWIPFIVAVLYVVAHHGIVGTIYPEHVFNHPAAIAQPWKWAAVHGIFIAGASAVGLVTWRFNERSQQAATEERFRELVETLPATFYTAKPGASGSWTYVSPQIRDLVGFDPEEWIADPTAWYEAIHPADRERVLAAERHLVTDWVPHSIEYRLYHRDGRMLWVRDEATLVRDGSSSAEFVQGFMLDITDRKQAESDASQSEAHRKAIVGAALDGIIVADVSGRILEFNPAAEEIFGYRREEVLGKDLADTIIPPSLRARHRASLSRYVETGESTILSRRVEIEGMRRDESIIPVELSITHDQREGKDVLVGFVRDITARKEAEEQLAARARREAAVLELSQKALSTADLATLLDEGVRLVGRVLDVDLCQVFELLPDGRLRLHSGYGWPEDAIGRTTLESGPESQASFAMASRQAIVVEDFTRETRFRATPAFFDQEVASGMTVLVEGSDEPFGVLGAHTRLQRTFTADDVNFLQAVANIFSTAIHRKEAEDSRIQLEDQLAQVQKMEAVGALAGGIAHDFNNLLAVIRGYASFIEDDLADDDPKRDDLREILSAGEKGTNLVRQLLTFSRKEPISLEILNVTDVISDVTKMLERTVSESTQLVVETSATAPHAEIDRSHLEQILMNLVVNAKQAVSTGGMISIHCGNVDLDEEAASAYGLRAGAYICIAVTDDGSGIPAEIRDRIFDPFFTTKEKGVGTGLGLATVYGIVKRAGGQISVYSEEGVGTTFRVYLPQVTPADPVSQPRDSEGDDLNGDETILVVEDEKAICALIHRVLSDHGYDVVSTTSSIEALRAAEECEGINLLVTDVVLPQLSGKDLSDALNKKRKMKTLFISGYTDDIINQHGLAEAGHAYLEKPFTTRDLLLNVRRALDTP